MSYEELVTRVRVFADGADLPGIAALAAKPWVQGFTTNPTLMRAAGVTDYPRFAADVLEVVSGRPISFEVFADEWAEMERQALEIASWGANVNVKIPVTNTAGESAAPLVRRLAEQGVKVNVTAIMTCKQVHEVAGCMAYGPGGYVSVFAGRIADSGRDPVPVMAEAVDILADHPHLELIWASPRELLNVVQAADVGCHVITATPGILDKLELVGRDLDDFSLATVQMFHNDARAAGYTL